MCFLARNNRKNVTPSASERGGRAASRQESAPGAACCAPTKNHLGSHFAIDGRHHAKQLRRARRCRAPADTKTTLGLVGELVGLAFPGAKGFEGFVAHERKHGNFAFGVRLWNFLVDE